MISQPLINIDIAIFIVFLLINMAIGLFMGRKVNNIKDYALGNRNFTTAAIVATIVATWVDGSAFVTIASFQNYQTLLYFALPGIFDGLSFFIISYFCIPRMTEFLGKLSVAEAMGSLYDWRVRSVAAMAGIIAAVGNIAIQSSIMSIVLKHLLGISSLISMLLSSFIIIAYSAFGGIRAITFTHIIQFFTLGVVIPSIAVFILNSFYEPGSVFNILANNSFSYSQSNIFTTVSLFLFFLIPDLDPVIFQRISMAKNTQQAAKAFYTAGIIITFCIYGIFYLIGILVVASTQQSLNSSEVIIYILDKCVVGFKGFFVIGIMAMIMVSADSYINSAGILLVNDCLKIIPGLRISDWQEVILVRISALLIGISALLLSLLSHSLFDLILLVYSCYMPIVSAPLLLAIFGFRSSSNITLIGMFVGFATAVALKIFAISQSAAIGGMLANLLFISACRYLLPSAEADKSNKDKTFLSTVKIESQQKLAKLINLTKNFSFTKFWAEEAPKDEKIYVYFGLFCIILVLLDAYSFPKSLHHQYDGVINYLYYSILIISTLFITYPLWLEKYRQSCLISILWYIALFYNLVFTSGITVLLSNFYQMQLIIFIISLITIGVLVKWQGAILMIFGGMLASFFIYKNYLFIPGIMQPIGEGQPLTIYSLLLISGVLMAFLKPKQELQVLADTEVEHLGSRISNLNEEVGKLLDVKNEFLRNIEHEKHAPLTGLVSLSQTLAEKYDTLSDKQRRQATELIAESAQKLKSLVDSILDLSKLSSLRYNLSISEVNLSYLLYNSIEICRKIYQKGKKIEFIKDIEPNLTVKGDEYYLKQTLYHLISNAINYSRDGRIVIKLQKKDNNINFSIEDEGIGIPVQELFDIFGAFTVSSKTKTPAGGRGIGLAICKKTVELHGGKIWAESEGQKGATFKFVLPISPEKVE